MERLACITSSSAS